MLIFLVNTRPDIQFFVHQCTRFIHAPKMFHLYVVKKILRYLKGTIKNKRDRGLTFDINETGVLFIDCYVNTNFASFWNIEHNKDPVSSKSRTGFVIFIAKCPVVWQFCYREKKSYLSLKQ